MHIQGSWIQIINTQRPFCSPGGRTVLGRGLCWPNTDSQVNTLPLFLNSQQGGSFTSESESTIIFIFITHKQLKSRTECIKTCTHHTVQIIDYKWCNACSNVGQVAEYFVYAHHHSRTEYSIDICIQLNNSSNSNICIHTKIWIVQKRILLSTMCLFFYISWKQSCYFVQQ